ncbi:MAG: hypothetical protein BRD53_02290 [Bacteroidetes bacterium SW_7_64_58]|nr:MAG: hypothetical protein BRD53_02290 [Bacteroidetes bacterium SW_7_64_58]
MQSSFLDAPAAQAQSFTLDTVKSWQSFRDYLEDARKMWVISYCDSPRLLLELFDEFELEALELISGNVKDYRDRLTDEDTDLVDRLEHLKREGRLTIYTCPTKTVHSKVYLLEKADGTYRCMTGSANLTRNSWGNHTNHLAVFETPAGTEVHEAFRRDYELHREEYGERFLDDLTEQLDEQDEDRATVIENWVAGRSSSRDEVEEVTMKLARQAVQQSDGADDEAEIRLSLRGFDPDVQEQVKSEFQSLGGQAGPDSASIDTGGFSRFLSRRFGIPGLWVEDADVHFAPPGQPARTLTRPVPDDPGPIDDALAHLESYLATVDAHGQTNEPEAVKAHMLETLLYFFWAPFVNEHARLFARRNVPSLDKRLPFLYLQGESNSGKGTLLEFGLRLISEGTVTAPVDADEVGLKQFRGLRQAHSSFPLAVDDIEKSKVHRLDPLRNYWTQWDEERRFPTILFTSNDRKPQAWFRNRAKMLSLNVRFNPTPAAEAEVQDIIQTESPLFGWVAHQLLREAPPGERWMEADVLAPVRAALFDLYERADRAVPPYLHDEPAEQRYDPGRREWQRIAADNQFAMERRQDDLYLTFGEDIRPWKIAEFRRHLPADVRADQEGRRIVVRSPERFEDWLGEARGDQRGATRGRAFEHTVHGV